VAGKELFANGIYHPEKPPAWSSEKLAQRRLYVQQNFSSRPEK
jgi:hypothetical protein